MKVYHLTRRLARYLLAMVPPAGVLYASALFHYAEFRLLCRRFLIEHRPDLLHAGA